MPTLLGPSDDELTAAATEDITKLVEECAASLTLAEPFLRNKAGFSLHDSMAALQLTDRKMDCCEVPASKYVPDPSGDPERTVFPRPAPTALSDAFTDLPWDELTVAQAAAIGIQTLVRLQAFLAGSSVGESAATCLYAHPAVLADMRRRLFPEAAALERLLADPTDANPALELMAAPDAYPRFTVYVFAAALLGATEAVRSIVVDGDIYEEEDVAILSHDGAFLMTDDSQFALPLLEAALRIAPRHRTEGDDDDGGGSSRIALLVLQVYFSFLSATKCLEHMTTDVDDVRGFVTALQHRLELLEPLVARFDADDADWRNLEARTCDAAVNRPLVGNAPVRRTDFRRPLEAVRALGAVAAEAEWAFCDLVAHGTTLARVERMLDRVQQSDVSIFTRSLIMMHLFFDGKLLGQYLLRSAIVDYIGEWVDIPNEFLEHENAQTFLSRLEKPVYDTLKLKLMNRCRQRAYIEAVSIPDWLTLQAEAHVVDVHYRRRKGPDASDPPYFSQFVLSTILCLMDRHLSSGLELHLFCDFQEVNAAFWYREYILSALLNNLLMMRRANQQLQVQKAQQEQLVAPSDRPGGKGTAKRKNKNKPKQVAQPDPVQLEKRRQNDFLVLLVTLKRDLCRGTKRLIAALQQAGVLRARDFEFTSLRRVFAARFEAFRSIQQPPPLAYEDFLAGSDYTQISPADLLRTTAECLQGCKRSADQLLAELAAMDPTAARCAPAREVELRWIQKVCLGNSLYLMKLQSIVRTNETGSVKVAFEFDGPSQFCIVKLSS